MSYTKRALEVAAERLLAIHQLTHTHYGDDIWYAIMTGIIRPTDELATLWVREGKTYPAHDDRLIADIPKVYL
jgi:hypothetical protein